MQNETHFVIGLPMHNSVASGVTKGVARQWKTALSQPSSTAEALTAIALLVNRLCVLVGQLSVVWLSKADCVPGCSATDFSPELSKGQHSVCDGENHLSQGITTCQMNLSVS